MSYTSPRQAWALANRIPRDQLKVGTVYCIVARNFCVGVWSEEPPPHPIASHGFVGNRHKFGNVVLDEEYDWGITPTTVPRSLSSKSAPGDRETWLTYLEEITPEWREKLKELMGEDRLY